MESLFHLIQHEWQEISPTELVIYQLARGNTDNTRVIGLDGIKRLKEVNPDCAVTFKPNHLSEADFILLSILFRENNMKVLVEGGWCDASAMVVLTLSSRLVQIVWSLPGIVVPWLGLERPADDVAAEPQ